MHLAFDRALRNPETIQHPSAYIYAVMKTQVRHSVRQQEQHRRIDAARAADPTRFDPPTSEDFADLVANRLAVHKALGQLPQQQRTAVWATKAVGRTQLDAAQAMDKTPGTVATHVSRAVRALQASLAAVLIAVITALTAAVDNMMKAQRSAPGTSQPASDLLDSTLSGMSVTLLVLLITTATACTGLGAMRLIRLLALRRRMRHAVQALPRVEHRTYCVTCQSHQLHRNLRPDEERWVMERAGGEVGDHYLTCTAEGCRTLRTVFNKRPFNGPVRVPKSDDRLGEPATRPWDEPHVIVGA
ncbi:sigma-70 family RNA polymerase sigma factor [Streptomyces sp. NPDC050658]|uniref:sigma-70 family RNA polymerase sigma factor n=1 Tax=unclassified Streptomyces TaxID=2593676 RepID=UPI003439462E